MNSENTHSHPQNKSFPRYVLVRDHSGAFVQVLASHQNTSILPGILTLECVIECEETATLAPTMEYTYTFHMKDISYYKKILNEEKVKLEVELDKIGARDTVREGVWEITAPPLDIMNADENEVADLAEEGHIESIVLTELEARHRSITHALSRIDAGTYGICEVGKEVIEENRLEANPAARTCRAHMTEEEHLAS